MGSGEIIENREKKTNRLKAEGQERYSDMDTENKKIEEIAKRLRPKMRKFAYCLAQPAANRLTVKAICEEFKISKDTYYKWLRDKDRIQLTDMLLAQYKDAFCARAWQDLMDACDSGSVPAIKLYFEMIGEKEADRNDVVIHVSIDDAED